MNNKGTFVLPAVYDWAWSFADGFAPVKLNDKWGFINTKGTLVVPTLYDHAYDFAGGLALVELNDKWGFINATGTQYWED